MLVYNSQLKAMFNVQNIPGIFQKLLHKSAVKYSSIEFKLKEDSLAVVNDNIGEDILYSLHDFTIRTTRSYSKTVLLSLPEN